ncbi:MAG: hypothetical protein ABI041_16045, partial [Bdellovibrionia bacterium]
MKFRSLLLGSLFLLGINYLAKIEWTGLIDSSEPNETGDSPNENQKNSVEGQIIQGVANYLDKNPDHLPNLQNPQ